MTRPPLRGFIFDLDGVLTDTAEYHFQAWKRLADEAGLPFTRADNERLRGVPRRESLLLILGDRPYTEEQIQAMMARKNQYYLESIRAITPNDLLPGARELLEELRAAGLKTALGSASKNAGEVVDRLGLRPLLDAIADGYSVERQKPAPDLFLHAAALLGLAPAECAVVEDAAAGIQAAQAGGFRTVGLGPPERVGQADALFPSLEGVHLADLLHALAAGATPPSQPRLPLPYLLDMSLRVEHLVKHYRVHHKEPGLAGSLRNLLQRRYESVRAVDGISFEIGAGEIVGFLGPNGAGKTTTLKCLAGLLYPTSGQASVLGYTPHRRERDFLRQITLVMGQRNQLTWDLPAIETFLVNQAIYDVPEREFRQTLDELVALLDLKPLLTKQVRKLSLGERMKCELAASLLHRPRVLFLDEPTIGLDVTAQAAIRDFILAYNRRYNASILLTSHYMADVTALARRILVIDHGRLKYDGDLSALVERHAPYKLLHLTLERPVPAADLSALGEIESLDGLKVALRVPRGHTKDAAALALAQLPVGDVTIEDPPVEDIIRRVFGQPEAEHA